MRYRSCIAGILIVAMLCLGATILSITWVSVSQASEAGFQWNLFLGDQVSAEASEEKQVAVNGPVTLRLNNSAGGITIIKGGEAEVSLTAHKTAWGATQAEAEAELARLPIKISQEKNIITVQVRPEEDGLFGEGRSNTVEFTLTVPAETMVTAYTGSGKIELSGVTGQVELQSDYGDIMAADITGSLIAHTASGQIKVQNIQAGEEALDLHTDYGDITLEQAQAGPIKVHTSSGLIRLAEVKAEGVELGSDYGQVEIEAGWMAELDLKTGSGEVNLSQLMVKEGLNVRTDYGPIRLNQVLASSYDLSTSSGEVKLEGATGAVKIHSDYGDITVSEAQETTLELTTSSGTIQFAGSLAKAPQLLKTDYGNVRLALPETSALTLELRTDYGRITSDLPVTFRGPLEESYWQGVIGGGGPNLTASTSSGNISLEILRP